MTQEQDLNYELKKAYGLENLYFYYLRGKSLFCCMYMVDDNYYLEDALDPADLDFLLKSLSMQQGKVYFDDVKEVCVGMDELKMQYLQLKLAGIK